MDIIALIAEVGVANLLRFRRASEFSNAGKRS